MFMHQPELGLHVLKLSLLIFKRKRKLMVHEIHFVFSSVDKLGLQNLPLIHSYDSIQALSKSIGKSERGHDLVIAVSLFFWIYLHLISHKFILFGFYLHLVNIVQFRGENRKPKKLAWKIMNGVSS